MRGSFNPVASGERVALLSPSFAAPGAFPAVHELAMRRLAEEFGVEPVEYPTTRQVGAPTRARAADLMAAFADPGIGAVLASIGGDDQLTVRQLRLRRFLAVISPISRQNEDSG